MKIQKLLFLKLFIEILMPSINIEDEYLHYKNEKMEMNVNLIKILLKSLMTFLMTIRYWLWIMVI